MFKKILIGIIANLIFSLLVLLICWGLYLIFRRRKVKKFFKIKDRRVTIYLSNIRVRSGGAIGVDGQERSYAGSTVSFGESYQASQFFSIFNYPIPSIQNKPGILKHLVVADIKLQILLSPVDTADICNNSTIISLGSPGYNIVSEWIQNNFDSKASFIDDNGKIKIDGIPPISDTKKCFIERIYDENNDRFIFYSAGLSEIGTEGATYYLASHWNQLYQEYSDKSNFCILLDINTNDYKDSRVISKT